MKNKVKTNKGFAKRLKLSKPKNGKPILKKQSKGRGTKHLRTKQRNSKKRRIKVPSKLAQIGLIKKHIPMLKQKKSK